MVRRALVSTAGLLACLLTLLVCRHTVEIQPAFNFGIVSDADQVIKVLPESGSGPVQVSKNGYRVFDLDSIVTDGDDSASTIRWSLTPGPSLNVWLNGDTALIGPAANQVGESYAVFTATDPGGLSVSWTCPVAVFDSFRINVPDININGVGPGDSATVAVDFVYKFSLKRELTWGAPSYDPTYLDKCYLSGSPDSLRLTAHAKASGTTGIYLTVRDTVNHVTFSYSTLANIK